MPKQRIAALMNRPTTSLHGALVLGVLLCAGGCTSNLDAIDKRIERMVGDRAARLGANSLAPRHEYSDAEPSTAERTAQIDKKPGSINPDASEIDFKPADENRDVTARLDKFLAGPTGPEAKAALPMSIEDAFRISQRSGRDFLAAEDDYILSAIRLMQERHLWTPRFANDTTLGIVGQGDDGRFEHTLSLINSLSVTQRLPYGGSAQAAWVWDATEALRQQTTKRYVQSSAIVLSADLPLLRGAGLIAQEELIQSERNLIYQSRSFERFRRQNLVGIANDYFNILELRAQIHNQEQQLEGFVRFQAATEARVAAGRLSEFERNNAANQVSQARASLASLREQYILTEDQFKIRLGLDIAQPVDIKALTFELPEPDISLEEATHRALEFRLDLQNARDQLVDAKRGVENARNNLLPDFNIGGQVRIPTDADTREGGAYFDPDDTNYSASAKFSLPLDRTIEKLSLRATQLREQQQERSLDRLRDQIVVTVRRAVRQVDLQRFQLTLAEQQVEINTRRLEEVELKQDTLDPQKLIDARNDKLNAENRRDAARTNLRNAILAYLLETDQLRVARDGTFQRLGLEELNLKPADPVPDIKPEMIPVDPPK